jgi:hypothetical protein
MIVKLTYTNDMPVDVILASNQASDQPLVAGQSLALTVELHEGADGVAELELSCRIAGTTR